MKKRKSEVRVHRTRHPITRRRAIGTLAAGAGALLVAGAVRGELLVGDDEDLDGHWVNWEDGWAYPVTGYTVEGWWIVEFDDGAYAVDPAGWVYDTAVWYPIVETDAEGVWYSGDDGYDYMLEHGLEYAAATFETA